MFLRVHFQGRQGLVIRTMIQATTRDIKIEYKADTKKTHPSFKIVFQSPNITGSFSIADMLMMWKCLCWSRKYFFVVSRDLEGPGPLNHHAQPPLLPNTIEASECL